MIEEIQERNETLDQRRIRQLEAEITRLRNEERERIYLQILEHPTCLVVLPAELHEIVFGE